ncbi:MAG: hypothetical protein ACM3VS_12480 [Candidatus Dadabacteria bacterium]
MYEVILFFPDEVNMKAFILLENISFSTSNGSVLEALLELDQVDRACYKFGAEVRRVSRP